MGISPDNHCCCCAPSACGLRAGVLALAILNIVGGVMSIIHALLSSTAYINGFDEGPLGYIYFPLGILSIATGIVGIRATSPLEAVTSLAPEILKMAKVYWILTAIRTSIDVLLGCIVAAFDTVDTLDRFGTSSITAVVYYWVMILLLIVVELYFMFVIWSYKTKLHAAASGVINASEGVVMGHKTLPVAVAAPGAVVMTVPGYCQV